VGSVQIVLSQLMTSVMPERGNRGTPALEDLNKLPRLSLRSDRIAFARADEHFLFSKMRRCGRDKWNHWPEQDGSRESFRVGKENT